MKLVVCCVCLKERPAESLHLYKKARPGVRAMYRCTHCVERIKKKLEQTEVSRIKRGKAVQKLYLKDGLKFPEENM